MVKAAYQEVVEQLVKVFEEHLNGLRARERALTLAALCVGGMVLARNVCDRDFACSFKHVTVPPKAVCLVGGSDVTQFLLSQGWAELWTG